MSRKHIIALVIFIAETFFSFLLFVTSAAVIGMLNLFTNVGSDPYDVAVMSVLKATFSALFAYGFFAFGFSIVGIVRAAKKAPGQSILNNLAIIECGYILVNIFTAFYTISLGSGTYPTSQFVMLYIRLFFTLGALALIAASIFLKFDTRKKAKCILLISGIAFTLILSLTANTTDGVSATIFLFLLNCGQLVLPIMYLVSKDEDAFQNAPVNNLDEESAADALTALTELQEDLNSGRISDAEFDELRKQYIDKL